MTKPIKPNEVADLKEERIPEGVIEAFNEMIADNWKNYYAKFKKDDVVTKILGKFQTTEAEIYSKNWLDIEDVYRKAGWKVTYDGPAYCETYDATYEFKK